jgi:hypothetical protein
MDGTPNAVRLVVADVDRTLVTPDTILALRARAAVQNVDIRRLSSRDHRR